MAADDDPYKGREHSKIKHLFLAEYLREASFKVLQGPNAAKQFNYVDGFAGPWSVSDENDFSDSSFDCAVRILLSTRDALARAGRPAPALKFLLCEKNRDRFEKLESYADQKRGLQIKIFNGTFEDNLDAIRQRCDHGFTLSFIDPTGWNLRSAEIARFLTSLRGDFLINFMEHPISRHNSYEQVHASFARFLDDPHWAARIVTAEGAPPREIQILDLLKSRLRDAKAALYMPDFPILQTRKDRIQMRLILGTHHEKGVEVFRTVQRKMEQEQARIRGDAAEEDQAQFGLFTEAAMNQHELKTNGVGGNFNRQLARERCWTIMEKIDHAVPFEKLAARVMEDVAVRMTDMKDLVVSLKNEGRLTFHLEGRSTKPSDRTLIWRTRS